MSLVGCGSHTSNCINIILCLKNSTLLPELVEIILRYYYWAHPQPIIIMSHSIGDGVVMSRYCRVVKSSWTSPYEVSDCEHYRAFYGESIIDKVCTLDRICHINPNIRFCCRVSDDSKYSEIESYNEGLVRFPGGINTFGRWFLMMALVPGPIWDYALSHSETEIIEFAWIFAKQFENEKIPPIDKYNGKSREEYMTWLTSCLNDKAFLRAQDMILQ